MNKIAYSWILTLLALAWTGMSSAAPATDRSTPTAPTNLNAVVLSADEVSLSWYDNSADERGFYIQRSEDGISWDNICNLNADIGEYLDAGLDPETLYMYRVVAYNGYGESEASNRDTAVTPAYYNLELSFNLSVLAGSDY